MRSRVRARSLVRPNSLASLIGSFPRGVQNENVWYAYRGDGVVMVDKDYEEPYIHEGCTEPV